MALRHRNRPGLALLAIGAIAADGCGSLAPGARGARQARTIVERAVTAHGGVAAIRRAGGLTLELYADRQPIGQSRRATPPMTPSPSALRILFDGPGGRWLWESSNWYPGLGALGTRRVLTDSGGFEIDPLQNGPGAAVTAVTPEAAATVRQEIARFIPGVLLEQALASPRGPRLLSRRRTPLGRIDVVGFSDHRGREVHLLIDARTVTLAGFEIHRPDPVWGDAFDSVSFTGFRQIGALRLPGRVTEYTNGALVRDLSYQSLVGRPASDSLFAPPRGYTTETGSTPAGPIPVSHRFITTLPTATRIVSHPEMTRRNSC